MKTARAVKWYKELNLYLFILQCPCFYIFNKDSLPILRQFLEEKKDGPMKARDATGNFVAYLSQK